MLEQMGKAAKAASYQLAVLNTAQKDRALLTIADLLEVESATILAANVLDLADARQNGMSEALLDRLLLTQERLSAIASDVRQVCRLTDPVGQVIDGSML
ncbi:gamma-glutamyl-phosphate reductase, partial [Dickeya dadantii]|nr:gamma-glutamyl-phosphate reductase [Dickeya dadantii]